MKRDIKNKLSIVHLLDPQAINNTDTASLILDTASFDAAALIVNMGAFTGVDADSTFLPVLQESNTIVGTDFTAVNAADIDGAFTLVDSTAKDQVVQKVGYLGNKRYLRVNLDFTTGTGGITSALVDVLGILAYPKLAPASVPAAITAT